MTAEAALSERLSWVLLQVFGGVNEGKCCRWLKPVLVAQINFQEWTPHGHLRQGSFAGLRTDKDPLGVTPISPPHRIKSATAL